MAYPDEVLADTPLHYWRLQDSGSTMAAEVGTAGSHTGGTHVPAGSPIGDSRSYDGTDDQSVVTALDLTAETAITVEFLVKVAAWTSGRLMFSHDQIGFTTSDPKFGVEIHSGVPYPTLQNSGQQYHDESFPAPSTGVWHHVVIRYDRGATDNVDVTVDGVAQTMTPNRVEGMSANFGDADFTIGSRGGGAYFPGEYAEFAIYSGLLSDTRIVDHFDALTATTDVEPKGIPSTFVAEGPTFGGVGVDNDVSVKGIPSTFVAEGPVILTAAAEDIDLLVKRVAGAAVVGKPLVRERAFLDVTTAPPVIRAHVGANELTDAWDRQWQEVLSDTGTGQLTIANDDPDLADLDYGDVVKFSVDDVVRFSAVVEKKTKAVVATGEDADEVTTVSGRGILSEWEDAVVYPYHGPGAQPVSNTRVFNWTSPGIDPEGWVGAIGLFRQEDRNAYAGPHLQGLPPMYPDGEAFWIWGMGDGAIPVEGPHTPHPVGDNYFRSWFDAPHDGPYSIFVAGDNGWDFYIDGMSFASANFPSTDGYSELHRIDVELSEGPHLIAARVTNFFEPTGNPRNWGGLLVTVYDNAGAEPNSLGDRVHWTSWSESGDPEPQAEGWNVLPYPDAPTGWTPGHIIRVLLEEAQARGILTDWTLSFTDETDSRGNAWDVANEVSFSLGLDYLSALRQLAETYLEFRASPSQRILYAYVDGAAGVHSSTAFEPGVNVAEMTIEEEG